MLHCPLCLEQSGQRVILAVEYDLSTPTVTVADLAGCPHAERFGQIGGLTLEDERRLVAAAMDVWDAGPREADAGEDRPGPSRCA